MINATSNKPFNNIKNNITFVDTIHASGGTSTQWNTAYAWGNHAGKYWGRADTATDILSLTRASHDYMLKNSNTTGTAGGIKATPFAVGAYTVTVTNNVSIPQSLTNYVQKGDTSTTAGNFVTPYDLTSGLAGRVSIHEITTITSGIIDSLKQTTSGFNKIWLGEVSYDYAVDTVIFIGYGASVNVTVKIEYGTDASATNTLLVTNGNVLTSVAEPTKISSFNNGTIPRGSIISIYTSAVTTRCTTVMIIIKGHRV